MIFFYFENLENIKVESLCFCPVQPAGDVEVQRGCNRGDDQGGGDRGDQQA